jgi:hypothetical protein
MIGWHFFSGARHHSFLCYLFPSTLFIFLLPLLVSLLISHRKAGQEWVLKLIQQTPQLLLFFKANTEQLFQLSCISME